MIWARDSLNVVVNASHGAPPHVAVTVAFDKLTDACVFGIL